MAKSQNIVQDSTSQISDQTWNPQDILALSQEQEILANRQNNCDSNIHTLDARLSKVEKDVAILDPNRTTLPVDYVKDLTLADVFKSTLAAGLQAALLSQPHLLRDAQFQRTAIMSIVTLAETTTECVAERANIRIKGR